MFYSVLQPSTETEISKSNIINWNHSNLPSRKSIVHFCPTYHRANWINWFYDFESFQNLLAVTYMIELGCPLLYYLQLKTFQRPLICSWVVATGPRWFQLSKDEVFKNFPYWGLSEKTLLVQKIDRWQMKPYHCTSVFPKRWWLCPIWH